MHMFHINTNPKHVVTVIPQKPEGPLTNRQPVEISVDSVYPGIPTLSNLIN